MHDIYIFAEYRNNRGITSSFLHIPRRALFAGSRIRFFRMELHDRAERCHFCATLIKFCIREIAGKARHIPTPIGDSRYTRIQASAYSLAERLKGRTLVARPINSCSLCACRSRATKCHTRTRFLLRKVIIRLYIFCRVKVSHLRSCLSIRERRIFAPDHFAAISFKAINPDVIE